jgi:hypothetical protein
MILGAAAALHKVHKPVPASLAGGGSGAGSVPCHTAGSPRPVPGCRTQQRAATAHAECGRWCGLGLPPQSVHTSDVNGGAVPSWLAAGQAAGSLAWPGAECHDGVLNDQATPGPPGVTRLHYRAFNRSAGPLSFPFAIKRRCT